MIDVPDSPRPAVTAPEPAETTTGQQAPAAEPAIAAVAQPMPEPAGPPADELEPVAGEPEGAVAEPEPEPVASESEAGVAEPEAVATEAQTAAAEPAQPAGTPSVGPKIIGVAEEKPLPIVKQKLVEKPRREPLPWPELRSYVAAIRGDVETGELKELYRALPADVREEVTGNVRGFQKGARRPLSQYAAKQLARAAHTARRQRKSARPSAEIGEALGLAMTAELIASLEPERAAEVILPRRDLLDREARSTRRRQKQDEERRRDEDRRRRRENARDASRQTSFGEASGPRIKGLDAIAAQLFGESSEPDPPAGPEQGSAADTGQAPPTGEPTADAG